MDFFKRFKSATNTLRKVHIANDQVVCLFLGLPLELRQQIYGYLLSTKYNRQDVLHKAPVRESASITVWLSFSLLTLSSSKSAGTTQKLYTAQGMSITSRQQYCARTVKSTRKPRRSSTRQINSFSYLMITKC